MVSIDDTDFGTPEWHTRQCDETLQFVRETGDHDVLKYVVMDASLGYCGDEGARLIADVAGFGKPGQDVIARCIEEITAEREDAKARGRYDVVDRRNEILRVFDDDAEIELDRMS